MHHSNGKLLLFGEYFVLNGAHALAIPTQKGQSITVNHVELPVNGLSWKSFDHTGQLWFEVYFDTTLAIQHTTDATVARTLQAILFEAQRLNPLFLKIERYTEVHTQLEFDRHWGLGSSSTLIANIAQWAQVDAFELFFSSFSGSGYDIACALSPKPIVYQLEDKTPHWQQVDFLPSFADSIYFVYLEKKQNSREGIHHFRQKDSLWIKEAKQISAITRQALQCPTAAEFCRLMDEHENIVAQALELQTAKDLYFADFNGSIKSLGAWGGDFIMAVANAPTYDVPDYFQTKGFTTVVPYKEMIKD